MSNCWVNITEKEFRHWMTEIGSTHHIFSEENLDGYVEYFIEDVGLNKIGVLQKYSSPFTSTILHYKNENVVGGK